MKKSSNQKGEGRKRLALSMALTWDGARWPQGSLSAEARTFLKAAKGGKPAPRSAELARLLKEDQVEELRICWVPHLKGGGDVLAEPFLAIHGRRLKFRATRQLILDDMLGVVYRRAGK